MIRWLILACIALGAVRATAQVPAPAPVAPVVAPAAAAPATAQDPARYGGFTGTEQTAIDPVYDMNLDGLRSHADYPTFTKALQKLPPKDVKAQAYLDALDADLASMRMRADFGSDPTGRQILNVLRAHIDRIAASLNTISADPQRLELPLATALGRDQFVDEFWTEAVVRDVPWKLGEDGWEVHAYLEVGNQRFLPIYAWLHTGNSDPQTSKRTLVTYMSPAQALGVMAFCDAASLVRDSVNPIESTAAELRLINEAWNNYLMRGYPQFPWENVVNDWYASSAWNRPPTSQLVVLHPAPGLLMDIGSATTAELDVALLVHAIGYVHYIGDDRAWYVGGSATLAVPADDDIGLGYGLTVHCGNTTEKSIFPAIDVGLLWHEGTDDDGWMLSLGFDAARLLAPSN